MTSDQVIEIFREALLLSLKIIGPMLLISMAIGLIISILQAATQVHEQTLTFVPKLITIVFVLLITGPWIIELMNEFTVKIFSMFGEFA